MRFENYLNDNLNSEFKDVKNGNSSYNCGEIAIDYSKFKENHTKYKARVSNEEKKFDSLVSEINVNRLKKLEEERRKAKEQREKEEYEKAHAEQIRVDKLIKYNKRKQRTSKFVRILAVLLLVSAFVLYIVYSFKNYSFVEHFGTVGFVWSLIGAGLVVLGLSIFTLAANHNFSRSYEPIQKNQVLFKGRKKANFFAILSLIAVATIAYVFIITKIGIDNLPYTIFDERVTALLSSSNKLDYNENDKTIMLLYDSYMSFSNTEKNKLKEKSNFEKYITGYNTYKVELVKEHLNAITVENANELLISTIQEYDALVYDQKNMITSDMTSKYNKYLVPYKQVVLISDVYDNILVKYDLVEDVRNKYTALASADKEYVYNSYLMDEFELVYVSLGNLNFNLLEDGTYSVVAKSSFNAESLKIPRYYRSKLVTKIESLKDCTSLQKLIIPSTVIEIEVGALKGCSNITELEIPYVGVSLNPQYNYNCLFGAIFGREDYDGSTTVKGYYNSGSSDYMNYYVPSGLTKVKITGSSSLYYGAFSNCSMIKELYLPKTITSYGIKAFTGTNLNNVYYDGELEDWLKVNMSDYTCSPKTSCQNLYIDNEIITEIKIPESISKIGKGNLYNFKEVTKLIVPSTVIEIEVGALKGCSNITELEIPYVGVSLNPQYKYNCLFGAIFGGEDYDGSTTVKGYYKSLPSDYMYYYVPSGLIKVKITGSSSLYYGAFSNCSMIKELYITKNITKIEANVFRGATGLENVYYEGTIDEWNKISIGSNNGYFTTATRFYFTNNGSSEIREGNWWYYNISGEIVIICNDVNAVNSDNIIEVSCLNDTFVKESNDYISKTTSPSELYIDCLVNCNISFDLKITNMPSYGAVTSLTMIYINNELIYSMTESGNVSLGSFEYDLIRGDRLRIIQGYKAGDTVGNTSGLNSSKIIVSNIEYVAV